MTETPHTLILMYCTAPSRALADLIAHTLIEKRLAACVTLLPAIESVYRWQGAIEKSEELVLLIKTTAAQESAITAQIKSLHPYDIPCILTLPISGGNPQFLEWIGQEVEPT